MASHLLISPLPKAAHEEDDRDRGLQVGADGLDVDEKLATLTGLDNRDPQHRGHHQHQHKHPEDEPNDTAFTLTSWANVWPADSPPHHH